MNTILECILTNKELKKIESRLKIFQMLEQQLPQRKVAEILGVGIATVTRGVQARRSKIILKRYL